MAKHKRTVALFEVIQKDKRFQRRGEGLPTPAWMAKGKPSAPAAAVAPPPPVEKIQPAAPPELPGSGIQPDAADSWPVNGPAETFAPLAPGAPKSASPITRTSAAIIAAAAVIVIAVGIYLSRPAHPRSQAAAALAGPAHPDVLNVVTNKPLARNAPGVPQQGSTAATASATQSPRRQANMDYVVIHLYLTSKSANSVADSLNQHDVPCTVEHNVPGIAPQYFAVVGLQPFAKLNSPDYAPYIARIKAILPSRAVKPQLLKWIQSDAASQTG